MSSHVTISHRLMLGWCCLSTTALLAVWMASGASRSEDVVRAKRLEIVDDSGKAVVVLGSRFPRLQAGMEVVGPTGDAVLSLGLAKANSHEDASSLLGAIVELESLDGMSTLKLLAFEQQASMQMAFDDEQSAVLGTNSAESTLRMRAGEEANSPRLDLRAGGDGASVRGTNATDKDLIRLPR
jgi:hypothetical protein